jgi:glutamate synthase (NADPH/NADH) large chain
MSLPQKQGLYDPSFEHDSCGVGFIAHIKGQKSHDIVRNGIKILENLSHRGACGCDPETGDGAGILIQMPDAFFRKELAKNDIALPAAGDYGAAWSFCPPLWKTAISSRNGLSILSMKKARKSSAGERCLMSPPGLAGWPVRSCLHSNSFLLPAVKTPREDFERKLYVIRKRLVE